MKDIGYMYRCNLCPDNNVFVTAGGATGTSLMTSHLIKDHNWHLPATVSWPVVAALRTPDGEPIQTGE